jgi:CheY-like chemotaxis protein
VEKPAAAAAPALPRGSETLLLVEDDRLVRNNTETQLRSLGYTVVTAETPAEAIEKIDQGLRPDLLFTDVVMPGRINGFELSRRLQQRLPGLRVLLTSGYSHGAALETEDEASVARHFLGKPFRRHDLAVKVREALDDVAPG